jgi:hypothetical protein
MHELYRAFRWIVLRILLCENESTKERFFASFTFSDMHLVILKMFQKASNLPIQEPRASQLQGITAVA